MNEREEIFKQLKNFKFSFSMYVRVPTCNKSVEHTCAAPWRPEGSAGSCGAGITDDCELNGFWVLCKSSQYS